MIVFPVLNFVLPLMLTSLLLVNAQECIECKNDKRFRVDEITTIDISNESNQISNKNESKEIKLSEGEKKGNIY